MTFNLDAYGHQIPIGLGVQKTQIFPLKGGGVLPVRFGLEARYVAERNDTFGDEWSFAFQVWPIIPNVIGTLIEGCPAMSMGGF